ncbi:uncharacterized protein LOC143459958 isoform X1 [Clavelina lepadiformis]|uniref:uncharacterized protein LOC143459958 isoform X1 n=1 Tax=Clavelina lepadiformis TaxID=159417 RepID=UPI004040FB18
MEKQKNKLCEKSSLSEGRKISFIDPSDLASSSPILVSSAASVVLQQPLSVSSTPKINVSFSETTAVSEWSSSRLSGSFNNISYQRRDGKPKATISTDRIGHYSEATARSFSLARLKNKTVIEPGDRPLSFLPFPFSVPMFLPRIPLPPSSILAPNYASVMPPLPNLTSNVTYIEVIDGVSKVLRHNPYLPPDHTPNVLPSAESEVVPKKACLLGNQEVEHSLEASQQATSSLSLASLFPSMIPPQAQSYSSNRTSTISITSTESNVEVITRIGEGQTKTLTSATNSLGQATFSNSTPAQKLQSLAKLTHKFSKDQLDILRKEFDMDQCLWFGRKGKIAIKVNLTPKQVKSWFEYQRRKLKKVKKMP